MVWLFTVSTLGECGGLEGTDYLTVCTVGRVWWSWRNWFFISFYDGRVWWSWKNSFLHIYNWLNGLIFYSFYFERVWWSWKNWFLTVSTLWRVVVALKELIFNSFYCWKSVVVLTGTDFLQFIYDGRVWWSWKNSFLTVYSLGGCGGLERTEILVSTLGGCGGLERHVSYSSYIGGCGGAWKNWFLTVSTLGGLWWSWKNWF